MGVSAFIGINSSPVFPTFMGTTGEKKLVGGGRLSSHLASKVEAFFLF